MTEGTEAQMETVTAGVLFCMAITMLLLLHGAFWKQAESLGKMPEQLILFEEVGDDRWKPLDE